MKTINLTNIITNLQDKGRLKKIGGLNVLFDTISNFENFSDLENYIQLINEKYLRRLIIEFGKQVIVLGIYNFNKLSKISSKKLKNTFKFKSTK